MHHLQIIHLYEHDYNLLLAVKWRSLIHHCVNTKKFNPGQYSGLLGHDAITPTIIEEFQYEISRASKRPLVHLDYDATACSSSIAHQVRDGNNFLLPATIPECQQRCRDTQQEIRKLEKDSITLRIEEQTQLSREAIQRGDHETAKAIKYRLVAE